MIVFFADRKMNILGHATTYLPKGLLITQDLKTEDVDTGVASFECRIPYNKNNRAKVEKYTAVGNYLLRSNDGENGFFTVLETENDSRAQEIWIYAEDAGLDLLNEIAGPFEADKAYPIAHYVEKFAYDSGFEIGINEVSNLTRKLSWDGETTATERLASVATQFDNSEIDFTFAIQGLSVVGKYINIYKERGKDGGVQLRLNREIDRIVTTKSIANLATALKVTGGIPEDSETAITLNGYEYDDGDIYLEGTYLKSRSAVAVWSRYLSESGDYTGHICKTFSCDTTSQSELCNRAVSKLKEIQEIEVNYEVDISRLPKGVKIGDRVDIVDDDSGLYLSTRILKLETSVADGTQKATLGEHLLKTSGISQRIEEMAAEFAKFAQSTVNALVVANSAKESAASAQSKASEAVTTADLAQKAADLAQQAAGTAETKAIEAQEAAVRAQGEAENAASVAEKARETADSAVEKSQAAQSAADTAKSEAENAAVTAAAAKLDAEQAQKDIDSLGENLTTLENTMTVEYARKTDLTDTEAKLQTQITQNAAEISSTASKVQTIDETANNAAGLAQQAQTTANAAQLQADQAKNDADAAQKAADEANLAATNAQSEADNAKAAADAAQSVADEAEAALEAAKTELATVSSRVNATEEEIAAAQAAVDKAQANADAAQATADAAKENAATAQTAADNAQIAANNAQNAADEAQAAADAAQADVDALAVRVIEAETKITQNSEKIELMATKTEVVETLGGYATKTEMESALSVKADEITASVEKNYATKREVNDIQIGARNLIRNSASLIHNTHAFGYDALKPVVLNAPMIYLELPKLDTPVIALVNEIVSGTSAVLGEAILGSMILGSS